jgi:malonate transporter
MKIGGLFGALTPVFFVLALGYLAGKRNAFDADQSAGLSKLALTFALPASLVVSMTDIPKDLLLQQGRLVLALILSHAGLFLAAWLLLRRASPLLPSRQPRFPAATDQAHADGRCRVSDPTEY